VSASTIVAGVPAWKKIQAAFSEHGLRHVFLEHLGWSSGSGQALPIEVYGDTFAPAVLAEVRGYKVFLIETSTLPTPKIQTNVDSELGAQAPERITVFSDGVTHQWRWPHQTPSGGVSFETLSVSATAMPSFLAQRLVGLKFTAEDFAKGLGLLDVRDRVRGRFDGAKVTKKFFDEFKKRHHALAESIEGLEIELDRSTYATLLMNRLMLLYFLQKREFLNDDAFYLENCLKQVQGLQGKDHFFSFYRNLLLPMFFDRLAAFAGKELDPEISAILGDIPYLNGGIYEPSALEKEFGEAMNVPDHVFEEILSFFGRFNWHLDTRPSGSENEINPEVIGYIFEQYINYTAGGKKANGAYYTKEDVTGYMVGATLVPRVLDYCQELSIPFTDLVADNPRRYIHADMLHGYDQDANTWLDAPEGLVSVWQDDPIEWHVLDDAERIPDVNLPGETWAEVFYRRERVDKLVEDLGNGLVVEVNDLVTHNVNARLVLTDAIDRIEDPDTVVLLWESVTSLSVLDPTVGSGAFLFAAMEALEDIYHHIIDMLKSSVSHSPAAESIITEIDRHPNDRYFVRKSIALNNLYGTDLMPDAIETAQLRIFLALVSCLESRSELEPLPNLDFNLKCGNLVVGFKDRDDLDRFGGEVLSELALRNLKPEIENYKALYREFVTQSTSGDSPLLQGLKRSLDAVSDALRTQTNEAFEEIDGIEFEQREGWVARYRPFHWFIEFPEVIDRGGFDVIVGNPPYIRASKLSGEQRRQLSTYATARCPDIYAQCVERSLQLLDSTGRQALIVPLNIEFSAGFQPLRTLVRTLSRVEWWSSYGKRPAKLFEGAHLISTILILGATGMKCLSHSTRHNIFSLESRKHLFVGLEYGQISRNSNGPILRSGPLIALAEAIEAAKLPGGFVGEECVYLRPTGLYWFPVLPVAPAAYNAQREIVELEDARLNPVKLLTKEWGPLVTAVLGGKLAYFWWSATGDDFDVHEKEALPIRALVYSLGDDQPFRANLERDINSLWDALPSAVILVSHNGFRVNIRWNQLRRRTDVIDRKVIYALGLERHWRPLNVWYRQVMRSGGGSSGDQELSADEANSMLNLSRVEATDMKN